ncbi:MAG: porin family protein [Flavobacteriales bacterium]
MKKIKLLVASVFVSIAGTATAQSGETDFRENLRFGLKAGVNYSNVYDSRTEDFRADAKIGFAGGVFVAIPIGPYFGLQPEVLISQKGFKGQGSFLGSNYSFTRTTTYVDVPLQLAVKPSEFLTVVAGPQFSYLIKQKDEFNSPFVNTSHEEDFNNENIRKNIFGFVAGLDVNVKHLVLGARIGWDISNNNGDGTSTTPRYKNTWIQGTIGFAF